MLAKIVNTLDLDWMREAHVDDTFVPVGPDSIEHRFAVAGLANTVVDSGDYQFRFRATRD